MTARKLLNFWFGKRRDGVYIFLAVIMAAAYLAGYSLADYPDYPELVLWSSRLKTISTIGSLVLVLLWMIHANLHGLHHFLYLFRQADHLPQKQIAHVNSFCMTVFLIVTLIICTGLAFLLDPLWALIIAWFQSRMKADSTEPIVIEDMMPKRAEPADLSALLGEQAPPPAWMETVDRILEVMGWILIFAVLILIVRAGLQVLWQWITKPRHFDDDEKIYLKPVFSLPAEDGPKEQETPERGLRYFFSYNRKIRRRYRKEVLSRQSSPPFWASPQELEHVTGLDDPVLHQIYEKARYGKEECTEDDWKKLTSSK